MALDLSPSHFTAIQRSMYVHTYITKLCMYYVYRDPMFTRNNVYAVADTMSYLLIGAIYSSCDT